MSTIVVRVWQRVNGDGIKMTMAELSDGTEGKVDVAGENYFIKGVKIDTASLKEAVSKCRYRRQRAFEAGLL